MPANATAPCISRDCGPAVQRLGKSGIPRNFNTARSPRGIIVTTRCAFALRLSTAFAAIAAWTRSCFKVSTLLMSGGQTWEPMPSTMAALAAAIPGVRRVVWEGQSHFVTVTAPDGKTATARFD